MTDTTSKSNANRIFAVVALAVVAVVATLLVLVNVTGTGTTGAGATPSSTASVAATDGPATPAPTGTASVGGSILTEDISASDALQNLTDDQLERIAERNGMTLAEFKELLARDKSITITKNGDLMVPGNAK